MIKFKISIIITICFLFSASCVIKGTLRGLYSDYKKTKVQSPELLVNVRPNMPICEIKKTDTAKVYITNGNELKKCLKKTKKVVIYIWGAACQADVCYPLNVFQEQCDLKDTELFVVSEYYYAELMQVNYKIKNPLYGIDTEFYHTNLVSKYRSRFLYDLTGQKKLEGRLYYFEDGILKKTFSDIKKL